MGWLIHESRIMIVTIQSCFGLSYHHTIMIRFTKDNQIRVCTATLDMSRLSIISIKIVKKSDLCPYSNIEESNEMFPCLLQYIPIRLLVTPTNLLPSAQLVSCQLFYNNSPTPNLNQDALLYCSSLLLLVPPETEILLTVCYFSELLSFFLQFVSHVAAKLP